MPHHDMNKYVPIIALAIAGAGWCWAAWTNRQLRRRVRQLEQEAQAVKEPAAALSPPPQADPARAEYDELSAQYDSAKRELEAQEQARLLGAEDQHLALLKAELEALRADLQEDLESLADELAGPWSGLSTPTTAAAGGDGAFSCAASEGGDSAAPSEPRSPALGTPSPKRACSSAAASDLGYAPSAPASTATASAPTSGAATPLSPRSPQKFDFDDGAEDDWLSTDGGEEEAWAAAPRPPPRRGRRPEVAVAPPLPPLAMVLAPPAGGLEAALRAAFEAEGTTGDEWDNEEEWLMPTARTVRPIPRGPAASPAPGAARKQVKVPRLNLARAGAGAAGAGGAEGTSGASTPGTAKVTISARGGITGRPKTARGAQKAPRTSRLGGGPGGAPSPLKSARGAAPAQPSWNFSTKTASERALDSPPALFPRGGTTARRDAPTPRLLSAPSASSEQPALRRSPSQLSRAGSEDSVEAKPPTKIPRLQLPAAQES